MNCRRRSVAVAAGAFVVGALGGCSLLVSTDGLSTSADGGTIGTEDARGDGSMADAGLADGPMSGGDAADALAGPFCASLVPKPKFCADFDTGSVADYGTVTGMASLDLATSKSPPASLLALVNPADATRAARVEQNFPDTPSSFTGGFDVYVDQYDSSHDVELVTVNLLQAGQTGPCALNIAIRTSLWTIGEVCPNGVAIAHRSSVTLHAAWTHVDFAVDLSTPARSLSLSIDGMPAYAGRLEDGFFAGTVSIVMGISYLQAAATTPAKIHTDNVTFDYR